MEKTAVLEKPKTHEEVARGKLTLTDPYSPPFPYWHSVKFEKLEDILKEILLVFMDIALVQIVMSAALNLIIQQAAIKHIWLVIRGVFTPLIMQK